MSLAAVPARVITGLYLINSGMGKRNLPVEAAQGLRDMGAVGVPQLKDVDPKTFGQGLAYGEIALGAAMLLPAVPGWAVGAGLAAFSGGLLNMYRKTPGMTIDGIRPTQEGTPLSKDAWLMAIAGTLVVDSVVN